MEIKDKIIKLLNDKQVEDIKIINFKGSSPFLDYFIIGTVRNGRMANAIISYLKTLLDEENIAYNNSLSNSESKWFLLDAGNIVIHLFLKDERDKYDLEGLWRDLIEK